MSRPINNAKFYNENNTLQKKNAVYILEKYANNMKWLDNGNIIDIGCGDGDVTVNILKKYLPANFKELLGCDISDNMVQFANEHYRCDRTTFAVLDITGDLPEEMKGNFNHAFSFHVFHRIDNHMKAFQNTYDLLAAGGDCLLNILGNNPIFDSMRVLENHDKWRLEINNVDSCLQLYQSTQQPENEIRKIMTTVGFKHIDIIFQKSHNDFNGMDQLKNMLKSVNVSMVRPEDLDEYMADLMQVLLDMDSIEVIKDEAIVRMTYDQRIVYGSK